MARVATPSLRDHGLVHAKSRPARHRSGAAQSRRDPTPLPRRGGPRHGVLAGHLSRWPPPLGALGGRGVVLHTYAGRGAGQAVAHVVCAQGWAQGVGEPRPAFGELCRQGGGQRSAAGLQVAGSPTRGRRWRRRADGGRAWRRPGAGGCGSPGSRACQASAPVLGHQAGGTGQEWGQHAPGAPGRPARSTSVILRRDRPHRHPGHLRPGRRWVAPPPTEAGGGPPPCRRRTLPGGRGCWPTIPPPWRCPVGCRRPPPAGPGTRPSGRGPGPPPRKEGARRARPRRRPRGAGRPGRGWRSPAPGCRPRPIRRR